MQKKLHWLSQLSLILVGLELIAISINYFYVPAKVAAGGATGIAILLAEIFNFKRPLTVLAINIVMIILAYFFLKKSVVLKIIVGSFALPVCLALTPS